MAWCSSGGVDAADFKPGQLECLGHRSDGGCDSTAGAFVLDGNHRGDDVGGHPNEIRAAGILEGFFDRGDARRTVEVSDEEGRDSATGRSRCECAIVRVRGGGRQCPARGGSSRQKRLRGHGDAGWRQPNP